MYTYVEVSRVPRVQLKISESSPVRALFRRRMSKFSNFEAFATIVYRKYFIKKF